MKPVTLNQWFFRNTKLPLLFLGTVVALVQIGFILYTHNQSKSDQESAIRNLVATVATIGIEQGNRPLLESSFQLAIEELGVKSMVVCDGDRRLFHQPMGFGSCPKPASQGFLKSMITITPSGFKDYRLYFFVNRFQVGPALITINAVIMLLLGIVFLIIFRIQKRMNDDILNPLENDFVGDHNLKIKELNEIREKYEDHHHSKEKQAVAGAILEHNLSIGHNIKSIQQTLDVIKSGEFISERQQKRVEQVSKDIKVIMAKIADQTPDTDKVKLITSDETFFEYLQKENEKKTKVSVSNVFEIAVEHKNIELQKNDNRIRIKLKIARSLKRSFVEVVGPELRDILSNMMNNSIEAGASVIGISVINNEDSIQVEMTDNGRGIEAQIQPYIFDRGYTKGKEHGTGYGLYHGRKFIESWGGSFALKTSDSKKTIFSITLPLWEVPAIDLASARKVIILDDEESVHDEWKSKLEKLNPLAKLVSFRTADTLSAWFDSQQDFSGHLFFFDSDLGQNQASGESLIEALGIGSMAHLVTNNYNSPVLAKWCEDHSISLIPKGVIC